MTITRTRFTISAIPPEALDRIRAVGHDDFGNSLEVIVDDGEGGSPLRCCLRPAVGGERMILIAYQPFGRTGPYAEVGPVFVHAEHCTGYEESTEYPAGCRDWKPMIFRPYRYDGAMAYPSIAMVEGDHAEKAIEDIFADPSIELIHTRNVYAGCYMFAIHRSAEQSP